METIAEDERDGKTISSVLEGVCNELPVVVEGACKLLIRSIAQSLVDKFDPENICSDFDFCSDEDVREERALEARAIDSVHNCTACEFTVKSLQTVVTKTETRDIP